MANKVNERTTPRTKAQVAERTATPSDPMAAIMAASGGASGKGKVRKGSLSTVACPRCTPEQRQAITEYLLSIGEPFPDKQVSGVTQYTIHGFAPMPLLIAYSQGTKGPLYFQIHHLGIRVRKGTIEKWGKPNSNHPDLMPQQTFAEYIKANPARGK